MCGKVFHKKDKLQDHMLTYTEVRNFFCRTCGKKFRTKPTLIIHEKTHSAVKPQKINLESKDRKPRN